VRRQEMLQKHVERCEDTLSAKSEAKEALAKEVRMYTHGQYNAVLQYIHVKLTWIKSGFSM